MAKSKQGDDTLSNTMDIYWISAVMEISDCTISSEKVSAVKLKTASDAGFEL